MREYRGIKTNFLKLVPIFGIFPIILLFFNFINNDSEQYTGFQIIKKFIDSISNDGMSLSNVFILAVYIIIPLIIMISSILVFIRPNRNLLYFITGVNAVEVIGYTISLLSIKGIVDSMHLLNDSFMIYNLSIGYWITIFAYVIGLIIVMKSVRISPGYIILIVMSVIWLFPILWIALSSFRGEGGFYVGHFIPKTFTLDNYIKVITDTSQFHFVRWYRNTLIVSTLSCIISTFLVLSTAYVISRIKFNGRKSLMNMLLILGMFPGFMAMIAVYFIIKAFGISQSLAALVVAYSSSAALGYLIARGFFDTIPREIDEAAFLDGASKWTVFIKMVIPLSKSIIIFTVLGAFIAPWGDYIFARILLGDNRKNYTVAIGLFDMLSRENIETWYKAFAAGALLIAVPISLLFMRLQKYYVQSMSGSVKG